MITRIVKLTIAPEHSATFKKNFHKNKELILAQLGCRHVEMLTDVKYPNIHFTYSKWEDESDLNNYRKTELFKGIWVTVKPMFCAMPEAWSVIEA